MLINLHSSPAQYSQSTQNSSNQPDEGAKKAQQQIMNSLSPHLSEAQSEALSTKDMTDFTPEKVASRVVDFVSAGLAAAAGRGASQERLDQMYQAAMKGVEQGFAEAKEILEGMASYTDEIRAMTEETEKLTFEKLAEINPAAQAATEQVSSLVEAAASIRESMKIDLVTKDGDKVSIRFSNSQSGGFASDGMNSVERYRESSSYQLKVQGELDDDELASINALLEDVKGVAGDFFAGNVDEAFDKAAGLQMNVSELARFDLNLNVKSRVEVRQYQEMSEFSRPERSIASRIQNWLNNSVEPVTQNPMLEKLENPMQSLSDLIQGAVDVGGKSKGVPPGLVKFLPEWLNS